MIKELKEFISTCPYLTEPTVDSGRVDVDILESNALNYGISISPVDPIIEEDVTGIITKQYVFNLMMMAQTDNTDETIDNQEFYENFSDWLEEKTKNKDFREFEEDIESILPTTYGYIQDRDDSGSLGMYSITCQIIYTEGV